MKKKNLLLISIIGLLLCGVNQFANAQKSKSGCYCDALNYGCLSTYQDGCVMYCQDYCSSYISSYCAKHPGKCRMGATSLIIETTLIDVYPNPISNSTTISFSLGETQNVSIKIYDISGRLVKTIFESSFVEGEHQVEWNVADVNAGLYYLRMEAGIYSEMQKLSVIK